MELRAVNPVKWQDNLDFSQAIDVRGAQQVLYCDGQISVDADGNPVHAGDMVAQIHRALDDLQTVLGQTGLTLASVVRLNYYVTDVPAFLEAGPMIGARLKAGWSRSKQRPSPKGAGADAKFYEIWNKRCAMSDPDSVTVAEATNLLRRVGIRTVRPDRGPEAARPRRFDEKEPGRDGSRSRYHQVSSDRG